MMTSRPSLLPAKTTAQARMRTPSPTTSGGGASLLVVDWDPSVGGFPTTALSPITTPSPRTVPG